jgi:carbon-monoxide dehydrogenase medium subunit
MHEKAGHSGEAYVKLHQPASGFAIVGVAARVILNEGGAVHETSVAVTGVGPKAYRAGAVESVLRGKSPSAKRIEEASAHATEGIEVNADLYASSAYRSHLAVVYTRRALEKAVARATGQ